MRWRQPIIGRLQSKYSYKIVYEMEKKEKNSIHWTLFSQFINPHNQHVYNGSSRK